jgi:hypothetical protein
MSCVSTPDGFCFKVDTGSGYGMWMFSTKSVEEKRKREQRSARRLAAAFGGLGTTLNGVKAE